MKKLKRLEISEKIDYFSASDLCGKIDDIINKFVSYKTKNPNLTNIFVDTDYESDGYGDDDRYCYINITGTRLETDEEFNKRKEILKKASEKAKEQERLKKIAKEERERKEFERLKAKFEKK